MVQVTQMVLALVVLDCNCNHKKNASIFPPNMGLIKPWGVLWGVVGSLILLSDQSERVALDGRILIATHAPVGAPPNVCEPSGNPQKV